MKTEPATTAALSYPNATRFLLPHSIDGGAELRQLSDVPKLMQLPNGSTEI